MSDRNQIVHTLCFQTRHAIQREENRFVFRLAGDVPRFKALKLSLGSLEFPMVQYTIENAWNRFYFNEGLRVYSDTCTLRLGMRKLSGMNETTTYWHASLPLHLNPILKWKRCDGMLVVTCKHPHSLWSQERNMLRHVTWGDVVIISSPLGGRVSLSAMEDRLVFLSHTEFGIVGNDFVQGVSDTSEPHAGYIHAPSPPSPHHMCLYLSQCLRCPSFTVVATYQATTNSVSMRLINGDTSCRYTLYPTSLASFLGMAQMERSFTVEKAQTLTIDTEPVAWWEMVTIPEGYYGPSNRSMNPGAPARLTAVLELALNRLNFALPERVPSGNITSHFLMFVDPSGQMYNCPVPVGRHTPEQLCALLENTMTTLASETTSGISFAVSYEDDRFVFFCEVRHPNGLIQPADFSLVMNHPMQFDPERLGFDHVTYSGSSSYVSPHSCHIPNLLSLNAGKRRPGSRVCNNSYKVQELGSVRKLQFHATGSPVITAVIEAYHRDQSILTLHTYLSQLPYAHGFSSDDLVQVRKCDDDVQVYLPGDQGWAEKKVLACGLAPSWGGTGVVVRDEDVPSRQRDKNAFDSLAFCTIHIRTRYTAELSDCVGQAVQLFGDVQPFNICTSTSLPRSIPSHILGSREGTTQWGIDGSVPTRNNSIRVPPYVMPHIHNMEHPDYVLMYIDEGMQGTTLQHADGANTTTPFTKLVLYPMFREERMIPRDTTMISGESLTKFTVRFTNPDGTPYHFHGAEFSLTLNLIKVQD